MRRVLLIGAACSLCIAGAPKLAHTQQQTPPGSSRTGRDETSALPLDRWQRKTLPPLPSGMTLEMIRQGGSVFQGAGGCVTCHGTDAMGLPDKGSGLSMGLHFIPVEWAAIDSLVTKGIPEDITRTSIAMPPRGAGSNLTPEQTRQVAAYVWAIAQVSGEPWPGGQRSRGKETAAASAKP
jgi:mono/diheme cytochrome c family protein